MVKDIEDAFRVMASHKVAMLIDEEASSIRRVRPVAVIDAILAKKNLGTNMEMCAITIALGPGFIAGSDVNAVIETCRGHQLGRIIYHGEAIKNTGIPGVINGYSELRVLHAEHAGIIHQAKKITDRVKKGDIIAYIENDKEKYPVYATMDGLLRGLIRDGYQVSEGFKIADIDPRIDEYNNCFTISDKARCIAGGVLEAILYLKEKHSDDIFR